MVKKLAYVFWTAVAGIVVCLGMSIHVAMTQKDLGPQTQTAPQSIPVPAEAPK
jgi:hypothetical protein